MEYNEGGGDRVQTFPDSLYSLAICTIVGSQLTRSEGCIRMNYEIFDALQISVERAEDVLNGLNVANHGEPFQEWKRCCNL